MERAFASSTRLAKLGESDMHSVKCPTCGTSIQVDFLPVAGQVWCPKCQKVFPASAVAKPPQDTEEPDRRTEQNGSAD
jgi:uncharacterized Zn finger protein (UPF0148 family)